MSVPEGSRRDASGRSDGSAPQLHALILAGGQGTRFWPLSRGARPKQLLAMVGERSLLVDTVQRLDPLVPRSRIWVCTTADLAPQVRRELPDLADGAVDRLLVEPSGRDTLPAIAWAMWQMRRHAELVAVLPSDHWIPRQEAFRQALAEAADLAREEQQIVTLGVLPDRPETGFGYLEIDGTIGAAGGHPADRGAQAGAANVGPSAELERLRVRRFVEKPDAARARQFASSGRHLWNAGMFLLPTEVFLAELEAAQPDLAAALPGLEEAAGRGAEAQLAERYAALPRISIDFGLMEKVGLIGAVALDCGWSDLGSFEALAELLEPDPEGNRRRGEVYAVDSRDNLLLAEEGVVVAVGLEGIAVVRTGDVVLVMPRERAQEVKQAVEMLRSAGRGDLL